MRPIFIVLAVACSTVSSWPTAGAAQSAANSLSFGGKSIPIDMTSCSPDNSADGKSLAIAAINSRNSSSATIQFSTLNPASGAYTTVDGEDALGSGKIVLGVAGESFGDGYVAKPGQVVTITKAGSSYRAAFANVSLINMTSKAASAATLSGDFSCR